MLARWPIGKAYMLKKNKFVLSFLQTQGLASLQQTCSNIVMNETNKTCSFNQPIMAQCILSVIRYTTYKNFLRIVLGAKNKARGIVYVAQTLSNARVFICNSNLSPSYA